MAGKSFLRRFWDAQPWEENSWVRALVASIACVETAGGRYPPDAANNWWRMKESRADKLAIAVAARRTYEIRGGIKVYETAGFNVYADFDDGARAAAALLRRKADAAGFTMLRPGPAPAESLAPAMRDEALARVCQWVGSWYATDPNYGLKLLVHMEYLRRDLRDGVDTGSHSH